MTVIACTAIKAQSNPSITHYGNLTNSESELF